MGELPVGSSWGSFQIERLLGESPPSSVYRATQNGRTVALRLFNEGLDESTLNRFEDDSRRLVGLSHPHVLRVESTGREGRRRFIVTEYFESLSLRDLGARPLREACEIILKAARGLGAAWMRLILHRNLKPENILVSARGEVKVADFGLFQEPTPYWSPERRGGRTADMRGDLYSLGMIFRESLKEHDPGIDTLIHDMTREEPFDRVQMVEDVISRLESFMALNPAATAAAPPPPPAPAFTPEVQVPKFAPEPSFSPPPLPDPPLRPPWELPEEGLELKDARATMVRTLAAVAQRLQRSIAHRHVPPPLIAEDDIQKLFDLPATPVVAPAPVIASAEVRVYTPAPPPPSPPPPVFPSFKPKQRSSSSRFVTLLMLVGLSAFFYFKVQKALDRPRAIETDTRRLEREAQARVRLEEQKQRERTSSTTPPPKDPLQKTVEGDWTRTKETLLKLNGEMKYAEAAAECDRFVQKQGAKAPPESLSMRSSLKEWAALVQQADRAWKTGQTSRAPELLDRGGPARAADKERILAKWCDDDWKETGQEVQKAIEQSDSWTAKDLVERFLKRPHRGGTHQREAEALRVAFQADLDYAELADRVETHLRLHRESTAVEVLEAFLALPHRGGTHREEIERKVAQIKEDLRQTLFSGQSAVTRLAVSPNGKRVAFLSDGMRVMDPGSREAVWTQPPKSLVRLLAFAGDTVVASAQSSKITLWDIAKKAEVRTLASSESYFNAMAFSRDGKRAVATQNDGSLLLWDLEKEGPPTVERNAAPGTLAMAVRPDGTMVALAGRDKMIRLRVLTFGTERYWSLTGASAVALAWSPDGKRLATAGADETVTVWDVEKEEVVHALQGHKGTVGCLAYSADGARLASGGVDRMIRIWSAKDGSALETLTGHRERVTNIAFLPGGGLVSSSSDGSVRVWPPKE